MEKEKTFRKLWQGDPTFHNQIEKKKKWTFHNWFGQFGTVPNLVGTFRNWFGQFGTVPNLVGTFHNISQPSLGVWEFGIVHNLKLVVKSLAPLLCFSIYSISIICLSSCILMHFYLCKNTVKSDTP